MPSLNRTRGKLKKPNSTNLLQRCPVAQEADSQVKVPSNETAAKLFLPSISQETVLQLCFPIFTVYTN